MRVLHVTHQYPPAVGGSERYIADLSEALVDRGHHVDVFTTRSLDFHTWKNELPRFEKRNGVNVFRFGSMRRTGAVWAVLHSGLRHYWRTRSRWFELLILLGGGPVSPGMYYRLRQRAQDYDLIHLNCLVYSHVAYGFAAVRHLGLPVVITPHLHIDQPVTYDIGYMRRALQGADHVFADTEAERAHLLRLGLDSWRLTTVGVGVKPQDFPSLDRRACRRSLGLPESAFVVLFFGRKEAYKGAGRVVEAFIRLRDHHEDLYLLTVGPETSFWRGLTTRCDTFTRWQDHPAVTDEDRARMMCAADVLALPSEGEAFGIVLLEAWMMGAAVLGPRTPAVTTVVDEGVDGLLIAPGRVDELVAALQRMVTAREKIQAMGLQGRRKVLRRYTTDYIATLVEGAYLRVVRDKRRRLDLYAS